MEGQLQWEYIYIYIYKKNPGSRNLGTSLRLGEIHPRNKRIGSGRTPDCQIPTLRMERAKLKKSYIKQIRCGLLRMPACFGCSTLQLRRALSKVRLACIDKVFVTCSNTTERETTTKINSSSNHNSNSSSNSSNSSNSNSSGNNNDNNNNNNNDIR